MSIIIDVKLITCKLDIERADGKLPNTALAPSDPTQHVCFAASSLTCSFNHSSAMIATASLFASIAVPLSSSPSALLMTVLVFLKEYTVDLGHLIGDRGRPPMSHAIIVFIVGFWILDVANNMSRVEYFFEIT